MCLTTHNNQLTNLLLRTNFEFWVSYRCLTCLTTHNNQLTNLLLQTNKQTLSSECHTGIWCVWLGQSGYCNSHREWTPNCPPFNAIFVHRCIIFPPQWTGVGTAAIRNERIRTPPSTNMQFRSAHYCTYKTVPNASDHGEKARRRKTKRGKNLVECWHLSVPHDQEQEKEEERVEGEMGAKLTFAISVCSMFSQPNSFWNRSA